MNNNPYQRKRIKSKMHLIFLTLLGVSFSTYAQYNTSVDSTTVISIEVYQPFLSDAYKIKNNPTIKDTNKIIPSLAYNFLNKQVPISFGVDTIKPAKIKGEPLVKLYNGYAKAGIGNNTTPLAEIYYQSKRSKKHSYGFFGKHFSSNGIASRGFSNFSDNHISVFGKRFLKEFTLYGKLNYDRNSLHYYGIPDDLAPQSRASGGIQQQRFNKFTVNTSLVRNFTDTSQFDYHFNINYHHLRDAFTVSENNINLDGSLSKYHKKELYSVDAIVNFNQLNNTASLANNFTIGLKPHIATTSNKWKFSVGIGIFVNDDVNESKFHFYPEAEFKYNVVEHIIIPYVGINGGIISNNLSTFSSENPFINTNSLTTLNSDKKYDVYAGIRGNLSNDITFNTSFSKQQIDVSPLYVKEENSLLQNQFLVIYDNLNILKFTGELTYQKLEKIKFILGGNFYSYTAENEIEAWHKPIYDISLSGIYDLSDKIVVKTDLFLIGKQYARTFSTVTTSNTSVTTPQAEELGGVLDANLSLEYRYTKKLSAFINFNNIGAVRYQRFQDYPTQRFMVLGGLTYSF